ncbi:hypothetical protein A2U01_0059562, partial [Trifolium medium]|nr:hypothetical protein [Trifolium medium]
MGTTGWRVWGNNEAMLQDYMRSEDTTSQHLQDHKI